MTAKVVCPETPKRSLILPNPAEENAPPRFGAEEPQMAALSPPSQKPSCCSRFCKFLTRCCRRLRYPICGRRTTRNENRNEGGNPPRNPSPVNEQVAPRIPEQVQNEEPGLVEVPPSDLQNSQILAETKASAKVDAERPEMKEHNEITPEQRNEEREESSHLLNSWTIEDTKGPVMESEKKSWKNEEFTAEVCQGKLERQEESTKKIVSADPGPTEEPLGDDDAHKRGIQERGDQLALKLDENPIETVDEEEESDEEESEPDEENRSDEGLAVSEPHSCSALSCPDIAQTAEKMIDEELQEMEEMLKKIIYSPSRVSPEDLDEMLTKMDDLEEDYFAISPYFSQPEKALKFAVLYSFCTPSDTPDS